MSTVAPAGARPPAQATLRLTELVPEEVARAAVDAVFAQLDLMLMHLFPPSRIPGLRSLSSAERSSGRWLQLAMESELGQAVCNLALFAQTGAGELAAVPGALQSVLEAAYTPAISKDRADDPADRIDREEPPGALGLVVQAALARYRIEVGADVCTRELALLAGVDEDVVRKEVMLSGRWVSIPAAVARSWLQVRSVAGFAL